MITLFCLVVFLVIRPIEYFRMVWHNATTEHKIELNIYNFRIDCWCSDCGKVFSDEID